MLCCFSRCSNFLIGLQRTVHAVRRVPMQVNLASSEGKAKGFSGSARECAASFQYELTGLAVGCVVTSIVYLIFSWTLSEDAGVPLLGGWDSYWNRGEVQKYLAKSHSAATTAWLDVVWPVLRTRCQGDEMSHVSVGGRCHGLGASRVFAVSDALSRFPACGCARWCWLHGKE